jgi:hypothetical protein
MAIDYTEILQKDRESEVDHAALTPVFYERARQKTKRRLTKTRGRASLTKRATGQNKAAASSKTSGGRKAMAKKKAKRGRRKSGRLTKAEIKKAGGIKQAWRARKRGKRAKVKAPRKRARAARKTAAPRRKRRRKSAKRAEPRRTRKRRKSGSRKKRRGGRRKTRRSMSMRVPRKTKKVYVVAAERRRRRRKGRRRGRRRSHEAAAMERRRPRRRSRRRRGAMENPLSGVELFVGGLLGVAGFGLADFTDRLLATHPLTDKGSQDAEGHELYADNPPTTGSYAGLFNPTAITSPMDLARWANAVLVPGVVFVIAHFVNGPTFRSSLQFFAFGYGIRGLGKGVIDGMALITRKFGLGQRLYDGEMRAMVLKDNQGNQQANPLASLPAAGLGSVKQVGAGKADCPECAKNKQPQGVGWPSLPREQPGAPSTSNPPGTTTAPPPPAGGGGGGQARTQPNLPPPAPGPLLGPPASQKQHRRYAPFGDYAH